MRIALEKVDFLPPGKVTDDTSVLTLKNLVFEPLLRWQDGFVRPGLFARWEHDADGRSWRFHIRPGARFHDGVPCEAAHILDFIDTILNAVDTFGMKWSYARYFSHARFIAIDAGCVGVETPAPMADMLDVFSEFFIARVTADGTATLGTGPYRVASFSPRDSALLERVTGSGPQHLHVRQEPDADARLHLLRDGEADAALNLERTERLAKDDDLVWLESLNTLSVMYYLNAAQGIFQSPAARLAVNHAVDVQAIIDRLFHGQGVRAATIVSPFHLGARIATLSPIANDPVRARALLAEAGIAPGTAITLRTPEFMPERALGISRMVATDLEAIGLRVCIDVQTDRPEYAREIGRKQMGDMAIFDSSPHSSFRVLNDKISSAVRAVWWQGYDNPQVEHLIGAANAAVSDTDRETAYARCLQALNADPPWLYLFHPIERCGLRPGISGLSLDHKGVLTIAPDG